MRAPSLPKERWYRDAPIILDAVRCADGVWRVPLLDEPQEGLMEIAQDACSPLDDVLLQLIGVKRKI